MKFKFELNANVKDKVTGYNGVILGRTQYSTGCVQYGVALMGLDKDGKLVDWEWFDESRLKLLNKKGISGLKAMGGPSPKAPEIN